LRLPKGIVIVTIAINVIRIELVNIFAEIDEEETTTCRIRVELARVIPIANVLGIGELPGFEVFYLACLDMCEIHDAIPNHYSFEFYLERRL